VVHSATIKGYEIGRIYRDGQVTIVDVTYWDYETTAKSVPFSCLVDKASIKEALAENPAFKLSADAASKVADSTVPDTTQIRIEGIDNYTVTTKKGIIAKEKITWKADMTEPQIYKDLDNRLAQMNEAEDEVAK
jgi:hypothetical protein